MLRVESPVRISVRTVKRKVTIRGRAMSPGQKVTLVWGAANRDPNVFPDPGRADIRRSPNKHIAFGTGVHVCVGLDLARLEARLAARVAIEEVLRRLPDFVVSPEEEIVRYNLGGIVGGVWSLPATFPPGVASGRGSDRHASVSRPSRPAASR
jgi:cytochrome P450